MSEFNRKGKSISRPKMKNLVQYRDMPDDEFDELMEKKEFVVEASDVLEKRIVEKMNEFSQDYDISDLKINDMQILRGLIQALISLEDYEQLLFIIRKEGITGENILLIDKMQGIVEKLRKSISDFQNDLNITRKVRKSDQEQSVIAYIESLKEKAREFYQSRMSYIFCPKCNTLLGTIWTLYPEQERNKIALVCDRKLSDGSTCGEKVIVSTKELLENRGTNNKDVMPESLL